MALVRASLTVIPIAVGDCPCDSGIGGTRQRAKGGQEQEKEITRVEPKVLGCIARVELIKLIIFFYLWKN